jgi:hypothetical protein
MLIYRPLDYCVVIYANYELQPGLQLRKFHVPLDCVVIRANMVATKFDGECRPKNNHSHI